MPGTKTGLFTPVRSSPVPEFRYLVAGWVSVTTEAGCDELEYWERRWRAVSNRSGSFKLANFP